MGPVIVTVWRRRHNDALTSHWCSHYKIKAVHIVDILIAIDKLLPPAQAWYFLYINCVLIKLCC